MGLFSKWTDKIGKGITSIKSKDVKGAYTAVTKTVAPVLRPIGKFGRTTLGNLEQLQSNIVGATGGLLDTLTSPTFMYIALGIGGVILYKTLQ